MNEGDRPFQNITTHMPDTHKPNVSSDVRPGRKLGEYLLTREIGRGGMGRVFSADDARLKRKVAIKILHRSDVGHIERFAREARAQARVEHEAVCPIFDVGEFDGLPYIVMPFLDGKALHEIADAMALESKIVVMRTVANAVHAANELGLIHRDLKPSNIVVVEDEQGRLKPFVVDFGIARVTHEVSLTVDGGQLGTPGYMAPEQIRGENRQLDRRADVYGLGATLFYLIEGRAPGHRQLSSDKPPEVTAPIPKDIVHLVQRCLEPNADDRYPSARAVAEDLKRYLVGEALVARPLPRWSRWLRRARRNPRMALGIAALTTIAIASIIGGLIAVARAELRERGIRRFAQRAEKIDSVARFSLLAPLHDVREDRRNLRRQMEALADDATTYGVPGLADYGRGRGHLALNELSDAQRFLEAAWARGYREAPVAEALGTVLSRTYRRQLAEIELVADAVARAQKGRALAARYRRRTIEYLRATGRDTESYDFLNSLLAFHEERYDEALAHLRNLQHKRPWRHDAWLLEGDIHRTIGLHHIATKRDTEAREAFDRAIQAFCEAHRIAESDPAAGRGVIKTVYFSMRLDVIGDAPLDAQYEQGLTFATTATTAYPGDGDTWLWIARLHRLYAQRLRTRARDPGHHLAKAIAAADAARHGLTNSSLANLEKGYAYRSRALWMTDRGDDPGPDLRAATAAFEEVNSQDRDYAFYKALGDMYMARATASVRAGAPSTDLFDATLAAYKESINRHHAPFHALIGLGAALLRLSNQQPGRLEPLLRAKEAVERAQAIQPEHVAPAYYLGVVELKLAQGADPVAGYLVHPYR